MHKLIIAAAMLFSLLPAAKAQYYFYDDKYFDNDLLFDAGASIGIMNCFTDLGGKKGLGKGFIKDLNMKNTQFAGGAYVTAMYREMIGVRLEGTFGQVKAYDSILKGDASPGKNRYERNLNFRSTISEFMLALEIHPLKIFAKEDQGNMRLSPYIMGGVGLFSFNPQGNLNNTWVNLEPLRTEGQGFKEHPDRARYKLRQMNVPLGLGVKYEISSLLNARVEVVHRILFTDYLDDVSHVYIDPALFANYLTPQQAALAQTLADRRSAINPGIVPEAGQLRGDKNDNDAYFTINFKIGITLGRQRR